MRPSARTQALIGGRWAISLKGLALVLVVWLGTAVATSGTGSDTVAVATVAAGVAAGGAVMLAAHLTLFRNRATRPVPVWWVAALGALAWLATLPFRLTFGFGAQYGAVTVTEWRVVLVVGAMVVQGAVVWVAICLALALADDYQRRRADLVEQAVRLEAARLRDTGAIAALRGALIEETHREIAPSLDNAAGALDRALRDDDLDALPGVATMLTEAAAGTVRTQSHRLWRTRDRSLPRVRVRAIIHEALSTNPLPLAAALTTFTVLILVMGVARAGWPFVPVALACMGVITVLYAAGGAAIRQRPEATVLIGGVTIAASTLGVALVPMPISDNADARVAVMLGITFLLCALGSSLALATLREREVVISDLADRVGRGRLEDAALQRQVMALERELAAHLHGTVHARLVTAAYALREAEASGDRTAARVAASAAQDALAEVMAAPTARLPVVTPTDLRRQVADQWAELLVITWSAAPGALSEREAHETYEVVCHALKNAVVHGRATAADIAVERSADGAVRVVVTDDGVGPTGGTGGMGTAFLDEVASEWSLASARGGGAVLRAQLAPPAAVATAR